MAGGPAGTAGQPVRGGEGRNGFYSIRVNRQWRITFCWSDGGAQKVRIEDYH